MSTERAGPASVAGLETAAVAAYVEAAFERDVLPALSQYTAIACLSPAFDADFAASGRLAEAGALLEAWCARRPLRAARVELLELPGRTPLLLSEVSPVGPDEGGTVVIYGHFDKQPALGAWRQGLEAFSAVREGDRLYGRGTADDGYAAFSAHLALEAVESLGGAHPRVVVLIEGSEESGSPDLPAYLDALAGRIGEVSLVCCLDSGALTYDRLWVTASLRGNVTANLTVRVLEEGVHSGHAGGIVPSSFRLARRLLSRIEDERTGEVLLAAARSDVPPGRRAEIEGTVALLGEAAAGEYPTVPGLVLGGGDVAGRVEAGTWRASLSVTGAEGLPPVRAAGNVLRPFTTLRLSLRLPPNCPAGPAAAALKAALVADPPEGAEVTVELDEPADGFDAPPSDPHLAETVAEASLAYFGAPPGTLGQGGSIPFLAMLKARYPSTQFFATGVLGPGSNAHGPNEFLHLPTAKALTCVLASVLAGASPHGRGRG